MEKAVEWYRRAQNDGSNEADWKLVECYLSEKGVEQSYDMAAENLYSAHHWTTDTTRAVLLLLKCLMEKQKLISFIFARYLPIAIQTVLAPKRMKKKQRTPIKSRNSKIRA